MMSSTPKVMFASRPARRGRDVGVIDESVAGERRLRWRVSFAGFASEKKKRHPHLALHPRPRTRRCVSSLFSSVLTMASARDAVRTSLSTPRRERATAEIFQELLLHRLLVRARRVVSSALLRVGEHVVRALNGGEGDGVPPYRDGSAGKMAVSQGRSGRVGNRFFVVRGDERVASRDWWSPRTGTDAVPRGGEDAFARGGNGKVERRREP